MTYDEVLEEYRSSGFNGSIDQFARLKDIAESKPNYRTSAYDRGVAGYANRSIDQVFETLLPLDTVQKGGEAVGGFVEERFGVPGAEEMTGKFFRGLPRTVAEFSTGLGEGATLLKLMGMGSAFTRGAAETGNPVVGAIDAATVGTAPMVARAGTKVGSAIANRVTPGATLLETATNASPLRDRLIEEASRQVAFLGQGEVQAQATSLAESGEFRDPFTREAIYENVLGNLAFLPLDVKELVSPSSRAAKVFGSETQAERIEAVTREDIARQNEDTTKVDLLEVESPSKAMDDVIKAQIPVEDLKKAFDEPITTLDDPIFQKVKQYNDIVEVANTRFGLKQPTLTSENVIQMVRPPEETAIYGSLAETQAAVLNSLDAKIEQLQSQIDSFNNFFPAISEAVGERRLKTDILKGFELAQTFRTPEDVSLLGDFISTVGPLLKTDIGEAAKRSRAFLEASDKLTALQEGHIFGKTIGEKFKDSEVGEFTIRQAPDLPKLMTQAFRVDYGYSPETADFLTKIGLDVYDRMKLGDAPITFAEIQNDKGLLGVFMEGESIGEDILGINIKDRDINLRHFEFLNTLSHELIHRALSDKNLTDPFFSRIYKDLFTTSTKLSYDQRAYTLENMFNMVIPRSVLDGLSDATRKRLMSQIDYLARDPTEFVNGYGQILLTSLMSAQRPDGKGYVVKDIRDAFRFLPEEERDFARGHFRSLLHVSEILQKFLDTPRLRNLSGGVAVGFRTLPQPNKPDGADIKKLHNALLELVKSDQEIEKAKAGLEQMTAYLDGQAPVLKNLDPTKFSQVRYQRSGPEDLTPQNPEKNHGIVQETWNKLFGENVDWWDRWVAPFNYTARQYENFGLPIVREGLRFISDSMSGTSRLTRQMLEPLLKENSFGVRKMDEASAIVKLEKKEFLDAREAFNKIAGKMQELEVGLIEGQFEPSLSSEVNSILQRLSPEKRQVVMEALDSSLKVYQNQAALRIQAKKEEVVARAARMLQIHNRNFDYKTHLQVAQQLMRVVETQQPRLLLETQDPGIRKWLQEPTNLSYADRVLEFLSTMNGLMSDLSTFFNDRRSFYMSEQRVGNWILRMTDDKGQIATFGAENEHHAQLLRKELESEGYSYHDAYNKFEQTAFYGQGIPTSSLERFLSIEQQAWDKAISDLEASGKATSQELDKFKELLAPAKEILQNVTVQGIERQLKNRKLAPGREKLDYLSVLADSTLNTSAGINKRQIRLLMDLLLNDQKLATNSKARRALANQSEVVLNSFHDASHKIRSTMAGYYLGANLSSMLVESFQSPMTLAPILIANGSTISDSYKLLWRSMKDAATYSLPNELQRRVSEVTSKETQGLALTEDDAVYKYFKQAIDDGLIGLGSLDDANIGRDDRTALTARLGAGLYSEPFSLTKSSGNLIYKASQGMLHLYGLSARFNNKISLLAGLRQGHAQGRRGIDLYNYARDVLQDSTFGGGAATRPGYIAEFARNNRAALSAFGIFHTLKQYSLGITTMYKQLLGQSVRDARAGKFGTKDQKAFGVALATQSALAGALGFPFAGAFITLIEELFGIEANKEIRSALQSLAGDNQELGNVVSDIALNGLFNHFTGTDLASRTGVNGILGFSEYSGFNIKDVIGPSYAILENMFKATQSAAQGNFSDAGTKLVPQAFKSWVEAAGSYNDYGDVRLTDPSNNLTYKPTGKDLLAYLAGFKPKALRDWYQLRKMVGVSEQVAQRERDRELDSMALLLQEGNFGGVLNAVATRSQNNPLLDPKNILQSVIDRNTTMNYVKDPTATGLLENASSRDKIRTLTQNPDFATELQLLQYKEQLKQKLGYAFGLTPADENDYIKASMLDQLLAKGVPRSQALQMIEGVLGNNGI